MVAAAPRGAGDALVTTPRQHAHLVRHVDEHTLRQAIHAAEAGTTAKIHLTLADRFSGSTFDHAALLFRRMGLDRSADRNNVLFFVAPHRRQFAVIGDAGIHERAGQAFWDRVAVAIAERIRSGDLTAGLVHGIQTAGQELHQHFPR